MASRISGKGYAIGARNGVGEIFIYDDIGDGFDGTTAKGFAKELKGLGAVKELHVFINSAGGSVFDGVAIFNQLERHKARVVVNVDGIAASIASVIAMAGDEIAIAANGMMMIHDPWAFALGSAAEMRKMADSLDKVGETILGTYARRTGGEAEAIKTMMAEETWLTAEEAVELGFADQLGAEVAMAAYAGKDLSKFRNAPAALVEAAKEAPPEDSDAAPVMPRARAVSTRRWRAPGGRSARTIGAGPTLQTGPPDRRRFHKESTTMRTMTSMLALQGWLATLGPAGFAIRNEAVTIESLQATLLDLHEQMEAIQAKADAETRALNDDEKADMDRLGAEFKAAEEDLTRRETMAARTERLTRSLGRRSEPGQPGEGGLGGGGGAEGEVGDDPNASGRPRAPAQPRNRREEGRWGWSNFGSFARGVQAASRNGGFVDPRLVQNAPTTFGTEGVGEDGGFAVPPEFREAIMGAVLGDESLIARTDQLTSSSNTLTIPTDETTPWQATGGIQAFWENEAAQLSQSKPALDQVSIRLNKLTALVPVTSELLEDAPALDTYLRRKAPEKMDFRLSDAIVNGSGAGQPLGIMNSTSLITVAKEGAQSADTIVFENVNNMYARMYARWRSSAVWLINQDIEPQLNSLNHPGDSSPVFMPPGGLSQAPFGTIFGRPVVPTEACATLGDLGDIIFASMGQYLTARKVGGIRAETSIHLWFDYDMTAFRFILRVAGQPWWKAAIARFKGANTLSAFVTLAERA